MSHTSNQVKQRWNEGHYVQVKVSVKPELAVAFKAKCQAEGVSMASEFSRFMSGQVISPQKPDPYATRQRRRKLLSSLISRIEAIADAERTYLENIPPNLQSSRMYEAADLTVSALEEALDILAEAY